MRLAVGEHHQDAIRQVGARAQQLPALAQRRREPGPALGCHVGIERVEVERDRRAVDREGRQDVARAREGHQAQAVALQVLDQAARLAQRAPQAARARILGEHRAGDVHGDDERQASGLCHDPLLAPARSCQRDDAQEGRDRERGGAEASGREGPAHGFLRPQAGPPDARPPRPRRREPHRPTDQGRKRQHHGGVETHQGTRTANVADRTISSARATSPSASGTRYASSKRPYTTCSTLDFSSRLISSKMWRSDSVSVARK